MRFSISRALAVIAAYAVLLATMQSRGIPGFVAAIFAGTTLSMIILIARADDIAPIVYVTIGSIFGTVFGVGCLSTMILEAMYGYDHGFGEAATSAAIGGAFGAVAGGLLGTHFAHRPPSGCEAGQRDPRDEV